METHFPEISEKKTTSRATAKLQKSVQFDDFRAGINVGSMVRFSEIQQFLVEWKPPQIFQKLLNFRKANNSTESSGNFGRKVKWTGNSW